MALRGNQIERGSAGIRGGDSVRFLLNRVAVSLGILKIQNQ